MGETRETEETEETRETLITSFALQKGGTGKSTSTINVGGALNDLGRDVLLVDLDVQGHLTEWTGHSDDNDVSIVNVLDGDADVTDAIETGHDEFDVLPAHHSMLSADFHPRVLGDILDSVRGQYDHILVDTPPRIDRWSDAALLASDVLIIVAQPRAGAGRSVELVGDQLDTISSEFGPDFAPVVGGLIANEVRRTNVDEETLAILRDIVEPVWTIPTRVDLQRAANAGVSIFEYDPDAEVTDSYTEIAKHLEDMRHGGAGQ